MDLDIDTDQLQTQAQLYGLRHLFQPGRAWPATNLYPLLRQLLEAEEDWPGFPPGQIRAIGGVLVQVLPNLFSGAVLGHCTCLAAELGALLYRSSVTPAQFELVHQRLMALLEDT